ncbi:MarR family transcriptional regulator [Emcibacter sp. SYSU 3D8]|uniref:MarR family winged helix-turn-helix transcriptional regulator n=1 Tax=Emcibacter sp. SYSU 3D8 TaxID=3133969 RepID=UPI0031FE789D
MTDQITNGALRAIRRILRAAEQGGRRLAATTGLTPSQLLVLQQIEKTGVTTPSVIAATLHFGQATVTNIVDRLEAAGLVTRSRGERDKRQILLRPTAAAGQLVNRAPDLLQERFTDRFESLPAWEQAMILAALEKLALLLDAGDMDVAPLLDAGPIDRPAD